MTTMISFKQRWNPQKILEVLANPLVAVAAEALAKSSAWRELRYDDLHLWGTCGDRPEITVVIDLATLQTQPSRQLTLALWHETERHACWRESVP